MYFAVSFHSQSIVFITILLAAVSHALPLETRTLARLPPGLGCKVDTGRGPCVCDGQLRLVPAPRFLGPLKSCGDDAFYFSEGEIPFKLVKVDKSRSLKSQGLVCDHILATEFLGLLINAAPNMCTTLLQDVARVKYNALYQMLNNGPNVIPIPTSVQSAKSVVINGGSIPTGLQAQDVRAFISYLQQLSGNPVYPTIRVATRIQLLMAQQDLLFEAATHNSETFNLTAVYEQQVGTYIERAQVILEQMSFSSSFNRRSQPAKGTVNTHNATLFPLPEFPLTVDGQLPSIPPAVNLTVPPVLPANVTSSIPSAQGSPATAVKPAGVQTAISHSASVKSSVTGSPEASAAVSKVGRPATKPVSTP